MHSLTDPRWTPSIPLLEPDPASLADPTQQQRVAQSLLAVAVYAVFAGIHELEAAMGLVDALAVHVLSSVSVSGAIAFYLAVRCGFNRRVARPSFITELQCLFGVACAAAAYAIHGVTRGAVLVIVLVILVFGMFSLTPRQARRVGLASVLALGLAMAIGRSADPSRQGVAIEVIHLLFATVGVAIVLVLSERLATMREVVSAQKAQLEEALARLSEQSVRDELTGLHNRRYMMGRLDHELARVDRHSGALAVVLVDIDRFKQVNDRFGHRVGDGVLRAFAHVAGDALRHSDVVARWGGEEFLLLLPLTPDAVAVSAIDRIRVVLRDHQVSVAQPQLRVTFSAGLAMARPGERAESVIERADKAMYEAKRAGRDRTVVDVSAHALSDGPQRP